ncbi:MAG: hypothetical protein V4805_09535, partial [Pseudomonadota bacterium]
AAMRGGSINAQQIATDAFGNALGSSLTQFNWAGAGQQGDKLAGASAVVNDPAKLASMQRFLDSSVAGPGVGVAQVSNGQSDVLRLSRVSGNADPAESDVYKFVDQYTNDHPNASTDEVQSAYDRSTLSNAQKTAMAHGFGPMTSDAAMQVLMAESISNTLAGDSGKGIASENWYTPSRSILGDAYRNTMHEALDSNNSGVMRVGSGVAATVLAVPGLLNDVGRDLYNLANTFAVSGQDMSIGYSTGDPYRISNGLMNASVGLLSAAGAGGALGKSILGNMAANEYAAAGSAARASYGANTSVGFTGAGTTKLDAAAEAAYSRIRAQNMIDVEAVANNIGLSTAEATAMKKQLFFGRHEYPLDGTTIVRQRFAADHEIAFAWNSAAKGELSASQQSWLQQLAGHELAERSFMAKGVPYLQQEAWNGARFTGFPKGAHDMAPAPPRVNFPGYETPWHLLD